MSDTTTSGFLASLDALGVPFFALGEGNRYPSGWEKSDAANNAREIAKAQRTRGINGVFGGRVAVLDIDTKNGAEPLSIRASLAASGVRIHAEVQSPSGGWHWYMSATPGMRTMHANKNRAALDFAGAEVLATGANAYLPGTLRVDYDGLGYTVVRNDLSGLLADDGTAFAAWVAAHTVKPKPAPAPQSTGAYRAPVGGLDPYVESALNAELARVASAPEGGRNDQLNGAAFALGQLVAGGVLEHNLAADELLSAARACGLGDFEARRTIASGMTKGATSPRGIPERPDRPRQSQQLLRSQAPQPQPRTEKDNVNVQTDTAARALIGADSSGQVRFARLLAHQYRDRLLHVHGLGWHYWDGTRWASDEGEVTAKNAVVALLREEWTLALGDKELSRDVQKCSSAGAISGILAVAEVLDGLTARVGDLDADPYALNCANGTLDLHTLELRPHNPGDRITKVCRAAYHVGGESPEWNTFMERVLPDADVRAYLARFLGVSLIGKTVEQSFTVATGTGANGKGVFYGAALHALGDYAHTMDSDLLTASRHADGNAPKPALVALRGRRFVVTSETEREVTLAAALMKKLTGGDQIVARQLHQEPIQFSPSHSLLMVTNHLPKVPGNDPAVWRRVRVVPFDVVIPEAERDGELPERLELAADAILSWAVAGLADYQSRGGKMAPPDAVQQATADYQKRSDAVARFLGERTLVGLSYSTPFGELWTAWSDWSKDEGADEVSKREFADELTKRGYADKVSKVNGKATRMRVGLYLCDPEEQAA